MFLEETEREGKGGGTEGSPSKDKETFKKWLDRLADALKRFAEKAVGPVAEQTWALIVFVVGFISWWLMQKVKKG